MVESVEVVDEDEVVDGVVVVVGVDVEEGKVVEELVVEEMLEVEVVVLGGTRVVRVDCEVRVVGVNVLVLVDVGGTTVDVSVSLAESCLRNNSSQFHLALVATESASSAIESCFSC